MSRLTVNYHQAGADADNKVFLHDIDSALDELKRWKNNRDRDFSEAAEEISSNDGERPEIDDTGRDNDIPLLPQTARTADEKAVSLTLIIVQTSCKFVFTAQMKSLSALLVSPRQGDSDDEDLKESQLSRSEHETMFMMIEEQVRRYYTLLEQYIAHDVMPYHNTLEYHLMRICHCPLQAREEVARKYVANDKVFLIVYYVDTQNLPSKCINAMFVAYLFQESGLDEMENLEAQLRRFTEDLNRFEWTASLPTNTPQSENEC